MCKLPYFAASIILLTAITLAAKEEKALEKLARPDAWANLLTVQQYDRFMQLVADDIRHRGLTPHLISDGLTVEQFPQSTLGLDNLVRKCVAVDEAGWPAIITEHFDGVVDSMKRQAELEKLTATLDAAGPHLRLRIYGADTSPKKVLANAVTRVDMEGTVTVLVLDMEKAIKTVTRSEAKNWGKSDDALFEIALKNLAGNEKVKISELKVKTAGTILLLSGDDLYSASHALLLTRHTGSIGKYGTLVIIPSRQVVLLRPVDDRSFQQDIATLAYLGSHLYDQDPGPISKNLFWYHEGKMINIPYTVKDGEFSIQPPAEFENMLKTMPVPTTQPSAKP